MGLSSSIMQPQELTDFRKLNTSVENIEIPARPESRTLTDRKGFIIYGITILIFLAFYAYSMSQTDFRRLAHAYDNCGNLCGYNNSKIEGVPCSGKNYESQPYSNGPNQDIDGDMYSYDQAECVRECPSGKHGRLGVCRRSESARVVPISDIDRGFGSNSRPSWKLKRSISSSTDPADIHVTMDYCRDNWWRFLVCILITIGLSVFILLLLRFSPGVVVWTVLTLGLLALVLATVILWIGYFNTEAAEMDRGKAFLIVGIIMTIVTIIMIILFIWLFKKIRLVIQLYKETTKAIFAMPLLMTIPVVVTLVQLILLIPFIGSNVMLLTAASLNKYRDDFYEYEMNGAHIFTLIFHIIVFSWSMQFIAGIQYMVISGSVGHWYFAKNKQFLDSPICTSFSNTFKFHLGTVAFGSFIITLMAIVKALIHSIFKSEKARVLLHCCCDNVEAFLKFLSKNAYIETAIHGQSFLRSGKRAAKLLITNAGSVIAINSVGDFVLGMIQFILIVISTGISVAIWKDGPNYWLPSLICFLVNAAIVAIVFAIFETTIDTLFICFCEDQVINDGMSKPYYMSRGLMEFVENSKKVYGKNLQPL